MLKALVISILLVIVGPMGLPATTVDEAEKFATIGGAAVCQLQNQVVFGRGFEFTIPNKGSYRIYLLHDKFIVIELNTKDPDPQKDRDLTLVWFGTVDKDGTLNPRKVLTLTETLKKYPEPCDYLTGSDA